MPYEIDPFEELERHLPHRQVATMRMLFSGDSPLGPGDKVRLAAACSQLGRNGHKTGIADITALRGLKGLARGNVTDAGVRFFIEPAYSQPALATKVAEGLLPQNKYPQAWRTSSSGGFVKGEVGPLPVPTAK